MGGEDQVSDVVALDMARDQRLVVPAREVPCDGAPAVEGDDEDDEGGLTDRRDAEPGDARSLQQRLDGAGARRR
jgi:hypothetical protein